MAIILPAGQAAVSAVAGFVVVSSVAWYYQRPNPLAVGAAAGGVVFGLAWALSLAWWRSRIESTGGVTPQPITPVVYPAETIRVELEKPDQGQLWVDFLDIPFERELIFRAAAELYRRGYDTAGLGGSGKDLTRSEAESFRDWMLGADLAGWYREDHHTLGWFVSGVGRSVIRRLYHAGVTSGVVDPLPPPKRSIVTSQAIYEQKLNHTNAQGVYPAGLVVIDQNTDQDVYNQLWEG